jgi:hypothetical protein
MAVLGSRDQMCIHPEVSKEENNIAKVNAKKENLFKDLNLKWMFLEISKTKN